MSLTSLSEVPEMRARDILNFLVEVAAAITAREVPAITGGASEGASRRNRRGGSAAGGWGRELNLSHCHPAIRMERYRDSERFVLPHFPYAHFVSADWQ
jgi:hypothetical protein